MIKQLCFAAAISLAAISGAAAQVLPTSWFGGGVLTQVNNCDFLGLPAPIGRAFTARYRPPNIGVNGPDAQISMFFPYFATNLVRSDGPFGNTFETVRANVIGSGAGSRNVKLRMLEQEPAPADVTENTPQIFFEGIVKRFPGFPTSLDCVVRFQMLVLR